MTFRLNAAARLKAAQADKDKAKKYFESIGVKIGRMADRRNGLILLNLTSKNAAVETLNSRFGTYSHGSAPRVTHEWAIDPGKLIQIFDTGVIGLRDV